MRMTSRTSLALTATIALTPAIAAADDFAAGSLIVPMDTTYQDMGMLEAYGLVYELLRQNVPVRWVIKIGKTSGAADFTAAGTDVRTGAAVPSHDYRGGPWVIDAADAAAALPVIKAWQAKNVATTVHASTVAFSGDVARTLLVAPNIAMMADGNQKIARKYMVAAKIPDSTGDPLWPDASPDMLDPIELTGKSPDVHTDGKLFDADADPVYCQFMSMHWAVTDAQKNPGVVAEMREFLNHPTHLFAECQAVNAFENLAPHGYFLTTKGFLIGQQPNAYDYYQADSSYAQLDGAFLSVGGSEPAYTLPPGEKYKGSDIVMITQKATPIGVNDVWMTGFLDGVCPADSDGCLGAGKVSYLGGHEYDVALPISKNPKTQGVRLFLNSLFESPCATAAGLPSIELAKQAPAFVDMPSITFDITYKNTGAMTALEAVLTDTLPPGTTFVSATDNGMFANGTVTWALGNLGEGEGGAVSVTVDLDAYGVYENSATLAYRAGVNKLAVQSAITKTEYGVDMGTTGAGTETTGGSGSAGTGSGTTDGSATATATDGSATATATDGSATATTTATATATATDGSATASASGTGGSASGTGTSDTATASDTATGGTAPTEGGSVTDASSGGSSSDSGTGGAETDAGCGCRGQSDAGGLGLLLGLSALALRPRRRAARAA
jgi:uncharacterized repeat protein (TIGR01451 family)